MAELRGHHQEPHRELISFLEGQGFTTALTYPRPQDDYYSTQIIVTGSESNVGTLVGAFRKKEAVRGSEGPPKETSLDQEFARAHPHEVTSLPEQYKGVTEHLFMWESGSYWRPYHSELLLRIEGRTYRGFFEYP